MSVSYFDHFLLFDLGIGEVVNMTARPDIVKGMEQATWSMLLATLIVAIGRATVTSFGER